MPTLRAYLQDQAVLWQILRFDSYGEPIIKDDPVELACRWDFTKTQILGVNGEPVAVDGSMIVEPEDVVVEQGKKVPSPLTPIVGSILGVGGLDEWGFIGTANASSLGLQPLFRVVSYTVKKDLAGTFKFGSAKVKVYKDKLPTTAAQ